jgi:DNA-directed RNA polymerase specialized sigma24 family protein
MNPKYRTLFMEKYLQQYNYKQVVGRIDCSKVKRI